MAERSEEHEPAHGHPHAAEPPAGGRQDHAAMQRSAVRPISGPAATDDLASGGGLEIPGREVHTQLTDAPAPAQRHEPIPGAREADTLTHREAGAMGGTFGGEDTPAPRRSDWIDETTAVEHAREGGGGSERAAQKKEEERRKKEEGKA